MIEFEQTGEGEEDRYVHDQHDDEFGRIEVGPFVRTKIAIHADDFQHEVYDGRHRFEENKLHRQELTFD